MNKKSIYSSILVCFLLFSNYIFSKDFKNNELKHKTIKALEDQLTCNKPPEPGIAIRAMIKNGFIKVNGVSDGIAELIPSTELLVFGKKVIYISGYQDDGKTPFFYSPGTQSPVFISVYLESTLSSISYKATTNSSIENGDQYEKKSGVKITCFSYR